MRRACLGLSLCLVVLLVGGCGPALSQSELGTVVGDLPKVAGADKPYQMPQLGPPLKDDDDDDVDVRSLR